MLHECSETFSGVALATIPAPNPEPQFLNLQTKKEAAVAPATHNINGRNEKHKSQKSEKNIQNYFINQTTAQNGDE